MFKILDNPGKLNVKCPKFQNEKVCIAKKSKHQYYFTFGRLGKSFWADKLEKLPDFLFFDPNNVVAPMLYNSLFDPHLRTYFKHKRILKHLRQSNLITDKNEVVCSAKEFNDNRRFLNRLKTEVSCILKHSRYAVLADNENNIQKAAKNIVKHQHITKKKKDKQEMQKAKNFDNMKLYEHRLKRIEIMRKLKENEMKERGLYRHLELIKKQVYVLEKRKEYREKLKARIFVKMQKLNKRMLNGDNEEKIQYIIRCSRKL